MRVHNNNTLSRWLARAATLLVLSLAAAVAVPAAAQAASASDFNPGFLVSDEDFFASGAMTAAQADAFIDGMNKGCLTGRVCLENYKESITAKAKNSRCSAISAASKRTAGQIIATVAKACGISPKAILVILQKEQSLVTAQAPGARAFEASMGAGCPDTAPCDGKYAGFYENVYYGAYLLKGYTIPGSTHYGRYPAFATSKIQYNPKTSCGTKSVYIENQATHALYVYTPYTPNKAALDNLYGTGDSCSAYGNRNFWRLWTDWFGPTGSEGALAIDSMYTSLGGATGSLGARVGGVVKVSAFGGGLYQQYANGMIAWTKSVGARNISKAIATGYLAAGGPAKVGWPISYTSTLTSKGGGTFQRFTNGRIYSSSAGAFAILTPYVDEFVARGTVGGEVGWPTANAVDGVQNFQGGVIVNNTVTKSATYVAAPFVEEYLASGSVAKWGNSTSGRVDTAAGAYQTFASGAATRASDGATIMVPASTSKVWLKAGGAEGLLGFPLERYKYDSKTREVSQAFAGGTVYTGPLGNGYVGAPVLQRFLDSGGPTGSYGFPTGGLRVNATGAGQDFGKWSLAAITASGKVTSIHTTMLTAWKSYGAENGYLGWPVVQQAKSGTAYVQKFEHGDLYIQGTKKAYVGEHFASTIAKAGGVSGTYGWPTSGVSISKSSGGGQIQYFGASKALTWNPTAGTKTVWGTMLTGWKKYGAQNKLGWATTFQATDAAAGARFQDFTKGRLYATSKKNGWVPTALLAAYVDAGGPAGTWGWPVDVATVVDGVTTQKFEKGVATATGTTVKFTKK